MTGTTQTQSTSVDTDSNQTEAAREATEKALSQAKAAADTAISSLKTLDRPRMIYVGALAAFVILALLFDMAVFRIGVDHAVSETVAQAQRELQAKMNSWSYPIFSATLWGKFAWGAAVVGIAIVVWSSSTKSAAAWVPLAEIACAAVCTVMMLLLFFVGFPDLSPYSDASCSATLLGYWLPLASAGAATYFSVSRLFRA